jgi:hypothetical protein
MQLMTGTGRSQDDVIKSLNFAYDNLSTSQGKIVDSGQKAAEFFATISSVANTLKLKFDDVQPVMNAIAEQFKFVGNETDAAAKVLGRYTDALRETGLTSKASLGIVQEMVGTMSNLTTGTKAFLSLRSGGPGGLQGGFQIDQLLRQGKLDQVVQMAERSLKQQFGGRIYSQAEAAQSPEAASQFMRQRQLLQSGAFGIGKGMSDDKATRLLESLGKGDLGAASKEIKTGQSALTDVTKKGADIQQRNNDQLKMANRTLERNAIAAEITAGATVKQLFGTSGANRDNIARTMTQASGPKGQLQNDQRIRMEQAKNTDVEDFAKQSAILGRQITKDILESGKGIEQSANEGIKMFDSAIQELSSLTGMDKEKKPPAIMPPTPKETQQRPGRMLDARAPAGRGQPNRGDAVYARGVANAASNTARRPAVANVVTTAAAANKERQPGQQATINKNEKPQKIVLEILAPPGFDFQTKTPSEDVVLTFNNQNANPTRKM